MSKKSKKNKILVPLHQQSDNIIITIVKRTPSWISVTFLLVMISLMALWLRVGLSYDQVFVGNWVKMTGVDAYYYMRLLDNLRENFPQLTSFDPGLLFPEGGQTTSPNFWVYFMGAIVWLVSLGSKDQHLWETIVVFIPPLMAVLVILITFLIGRLLGSKWIGVFAAGLLAIMPGEFLNRSRLGYIDHHVAEVLLSTLTIMFVFMSIKKLQGESLSNIIRNKRVGILYGLLSGVLLWLYIMTWSGAAIFVLLFFLFIVVQLIVDHIRGKSTEYLGVLVVCLLGICLILYCPVMYDVKTMASIVIGLIASIFLVIVSKVMSREKFLFPSLVGGVGVLSVVVLWFTVPDILMSGISLFQWNTNTTVMEMQPLLIQQGNFTFAVVMGNYMLSFFFSLFMLFVLFYQSMKYGQSDRILFLVWSVVILLLAFSMRRFSYYYAVNVALLTGSFCWWILSFSIRNNKIFAKTKKSKKVNLFFVFLLMIILLVYYPNIGPLPDGRNPAIDAMKFSFTPSNSWCETQDWLRTNTPKPLDDVNGLYNSDFEYSDKGYSVLSWWDYGYLTARMGERIPTSNPGTGNRIEAAYFTAQNEVVASRAISNLGVRYVIVDKEIASYEGKFHALATLSQSSYADYYDIFVQKIGGEYTSVIRFYPKYYYSMISRLYNFGGKAVVPQRVNVILCGKIMDKEGKEYKEIIDHKILSSYEEAQQFINNNKDYIIVGESPAESPVPLLELKEYSLRYVSRTSDIKVFEYRRDKIPLIGDWKGQGESVAFIESDGIIFDSNDQTKTNFGYRSDVMISGDWNGDKKTELGVFRPSDLCFYLDYNGDRSWSLGDVKKGPYSCRFYDVPVSGDWNGDGKEEIGMFRGDLCFHLDVDNDGQFDQILGQAKINTLGKVGDVPVSGDWNGDGKTELGVFRPSDLCFYLDCNNDGVWSSGDKMMSMGNEYVTPISGKWNGNIDSVGVWDPCVNGFLLSK
jgi:dolichyl-diphosphooligosaccharide--protein glycosyltransferase